MIWCTGLKAYHLSIVSFSQKEFQRNLISWQTYPQTHLLLHTRYTVEHFVHMHTLPYYSSVACDAMIHTQCRAHCYIRKLRCTKLSAGDLYCCKVYHRDIIAPILFSALVVGSSELKSCWLWAEGCGYKVEGIMLASKTITAWTGWCCFICPALSVNA